MPRHPISRQCARCGQMNEGREERCTACGTGLIRHRWTMTRARVAKVHALATRKGLIVGGDRELYDLRLQRAGVESCKGLKKEAYYRFIGELERLPDAGRTG